jgi:hypothetical protein
MRERQRRRSEDIRTWRCEGRRLWALIQPRRCAAKLVLGVQGDISPKSSSRSAFSKNQPRSPPCPSESPTHPVPCNNGSDSYHHSRCLSHRRWSCCVRWCKHAWSNQECTESKTGQEWLVCWTSSSVGQNCTPHLFSPMLTSMRRIDVFLVKE